ncbi:caffeine-induced death protein 2-domain-containing protein [Crucibulum laeve]|uniref:Caffeine-induced death protein 2-domain-containing protein n=1 Tax=Crucibulum laeve TaxID=68775 RepID=A0A5C3MDY6_9AGAR|nr:caffeine-induced death protein 2-domain-containing protein [Crucibulum laeve]
MPSKQPLLGSLALQAPSLTPQTVHVSPETCQDLTLFKELLREYRRLDDTINMRLNRANAAMRDKERHQDDTTAGNVQDQACTYLWRELVGNWKRRTQLVEYCVSVVDQSLTQKRYALEDPSADPATRRKTQAAIFSDEVKRNQVHNELTVESIVRKRAIEGFRSRCQYFVPPAADVEARRMWDAAQQ